MSDVEIAAYFGISKAGVGAWRDTGRIDKKHLPKLAALSGRPLEWWLAGSPASAKSPVPLVAAEPDANPHQGTNTVKLASPAVTLDLSADCLVVWQQLQQLPPREREEWRAKLDFAVASARMKSLGLLSPPQPQRVKPAADDEDPNPIDPKTSHTA
jgi:hypothetical protein